MIDVIYMILRRLRVPLIILIAVYAISIFGLAIAPGVDPDGNPWRMGFFHATYVMSYTATTIGFGELPFPFSDQQRASPARSRSGSMAFQGTPASSSVAEMVWPKRP